jgi:hypothetical protein
MSAVCHPQSPPLAALIRLTVATCHLLCLMVLLMPADNSVGGSVEIGAEESDANRAAASPAVLWWMVGACSTRAEVLDPPERMLAIMVLLCDWSRRRSFSSFKWCCARVYGSGNVRCWNCSLLSAARVDGTTSCCCMDAFSSCFRYLVASRDGGKRKYQPRRRFPMVLLI